MAQARRCSEKEMVPWIADGKCLCVRACVRVYAYAAVRGCVLQLNVHGHPGELVISQTVLIDIYKAQFRLDILSA